jgi:glycerophosphoryl diester phosphodiesterase
VVHAALLTKFDINFYLTAKPAEFWIAAGLGGVIGAALVIIWLRLATSWFYALPLVIFEGIEPRPALKLSRDRVTGHRSTVVLWIIGWLLATFLLSAAASGIVVFLAKLVIPRVIGSLGFMLLAVGATLIAWAGANLATNLLSTTSFAAVFFRLYADLGSKQEMDVSRLAADALEARGKGPRLTGKRLAIGVAAGIVVAAAVGGFAIRTVRTTDHTEIVAHRGASAAAPENTLAAVRQAVEEGTDWVEIDVQETADGEVVVLHDSDLKKVAGVDLKIWDATMDDLKNIDIGSFFSPEFEAERVPRLADVLAFCKGKSKVVIELKFYGHDQRLEERVAEIVEAHDMQTDIAVMSLKQQGIDKIKSLRPTWQVGLLAAVTASNLTRAEADFLAVKASIATRRFIRSAHGRNKKVLVWTVNDPISMSTMMGRGADGLITDRPGLARDVLEQRSTLSTVERLLIELAGLLGVKREVVEQ